jgi:2-haloacid dehalogenase
VSSPSREIDAVVFDLGNVLVTWDPYLPFVGRVERSEVEAFFREIDFPAVNRRLDAGESLAQARADVRERFPQRAATLDIYFDHFADSLAGPVPGSAEVVAELAAAGVRVLGLTNWAAETYHYAEPAAPVIGLLEDVLVSGEVGLGKPDPRIFALLAERYGLEPGRTLFIDDSPANVRAAASCGYVAVQFSGADALRGDLRALGLPVGIPVPRT